MNNNNDILCGFEFEFFGNSAPELIKMNLEKILNKQVKIFEDGHTQFKPTKDVYKLEKDYSGGRKMLELVTGPEQFQTAMSNMYTILKFIQKNGYTNEKCAFQVNLSFINDSLVYKFNKLKFVLNFNEDYVYEGFENRINSLYAKSIKHIMNKNKFLSENIDFYNAFDYEMPSTKYYGVNFDKLRNGYLEFRYLGGKDYQYKVDDLVEKINYFITSIRNSCTIFLTESDKLSIRRLNEKNSNIIQAYKSLSNFKFAYPKIELYANLIKTESYVNQFYQSLMRDKVLDIITKNNIKSGIINYNSDSSIFELKDVIMDNCYELHNVDLINCTIKNGFLNNCLIFESKIENCNIESSKAYQMTEIKSCKLNDCYISSGSILEDSYIAGNVKTSIILGEMKDCIFRSGTISKNTLDSARNVEFISYSLVGDKISYRPELDNKDSKLHENKNLEQEDYYYILRLRKFSTIKEVETAFEYLQKNSHKTQLEKIRRAYDILSNPITKEEYDNSLRDKVSDNSLIPSISNKKNNSDENYYKILKVKLFATYSEIENSYRHLKFSTDKNEFIKIQQAYNILTNPITREEYDRTLTIKTHFNDTVERKPIDFKNLLTFEESDYIYFKRSLIINNVKTIIETKPIMEIKKILLNIISSSNLDFNNKKKLLRLVEIEVTDKQNLINFLEDFQEFLSPTIKNDKVEIKNYSNTDIVEIEMPSHVFFRFRSKFTEYLITNNVKEKLLSTTNELQTKKIILDSIRGLEDYTINGKKIFISNNFLDYLYDMYDSNLDNISYLKKIIIDWIEAKEAKLEDTDRGYTMFQKYDREANALRDANVNTEEEAKKGGFSRPFTIPISFNRKNIRKYRK